MPKRVSYLVCLLVISGLVVLFGCKGGKGRTHHIEYHLGVSVASGCGDENISADAVSVQMLNLRLVPLVNENIRVEQIVVHISGTGEDSIDIAKLKLYHDANGNGAYDGSDTLLQEATINADDGTATFTSIITVPAPLGLHLFILADFSGFAGDACTYKLSINGQSDINALKTSNLQLAVVKGLPVSGGTKTVTSGSEALVLLKGDKNPADFQSVVGHSDVSVMQFVLFVRNSGAVVLNGVTLTASGTGNDVTGITSVKLYSDTNKDGKPDNLLAQGVYSSDDGKVALNLTSPLTMSENTKYYFVVVYDFSSSAVAGSTYKVQIAALADINATSGGLPVTPDGFVPLDGATVTLLEKGVLQLALGAYDPTDIEVQRPSENNSALQVTLSALCEDITVQTLTLTASGSGDDSSDISAVRIFLDKNGNGKYDSGEPQISADSKFATDNGSVTITADRTISENSTETWLVTLSFNNNGSRKDTYKVSIAAQTDVSAVGVSSNKTITASGTFPLSGGTLTILYDSFISAGTLNTRRVFHTQTTFYDPNDNSYKVLIAGGWDGTNILDTAEVYDPRTRRFTTLSAKMTAKRTGHSATLLSDGRILLCGGYNGANTEKTMEIFDPASQSFTKFGLELITQREGHLAVSSDSRVLFAYGFATYAGTPQLCSNFEAFDVSSVKRLSTGYVDYFRVLFAYAVTNGGTVVVSGGVGSPRGYPTTPLVLSTFELWRFSSTILHSRFTVSLLNKRTGHKMVALDDKVLVVGGYDVNPAYTTSFSGPKDCELYDDGEPTILGDERIAKTGSLSTERFSPIAIRLGNGKVLVAGGADANNPPAVLSSAEIYDPASGNFSLSLGNLITRRYFATESLLPGPDGVLGTSDDRVLIVGGIQNWIDPRFMPSAGDILETAELYIP